MVTLSVLYSKRLVKILTIISENFKEVKARINVLACLKKSMGLAYYTKCEFDSLVDQTHVLTEKECDSNNKAYANVNEVGGEDFKEKKRSPTAKPVIKSKCKLRSIMRLYQT